MSAEEFWRLSLRELWNHVLIMRQKQKDQIDRDVILAWQMERIRLLTMKPNGRLQLPPLQKVLQRGDEKKPKSHEEQVAMIYALSASLGVPVQRIPWSPKKP